MNEAKVISSELNVISSESKDNLGTGDCRRRAVSSGACRVKRFFDFLVSIVGMVVFSPLFLVIYIAIKREDGGKVIFRQERVGYHGKPFILYKFRSMTATSEADGKPALCKGENDKRLTHVGRFLREHHLDELPQLWNVCKLGTCVQFSKCQGGKCQRRSVCNMAFLQCPWSEPRRARHARQRPFRR